MLNFYRIDFSNGDFTFVPPPSFRRSPLVRQYHLALLEQVRTLSFFHSPNADPVLFEKFNPYYQKIVDAWGVDIPLGVIDIPCRHKLFIAATQKKGLWLSDLEIMMGYTFPSKEPPPPPLITTGSFELDMISEMLRLCPKDMTWLIANYSTEQVALIVKQMSDRSRGQEAIEEAQRQRDMQSFDNDGVAALSELGVVFPEV